MLDHITVPNSPGNERRFRSARPAPPLPRDLLRPAPALPLARRIPGGVAASLDALPEEALPRLDFVGPLAALRPRLRAAVTERLPRPRWLANWLVDDALTLVAALAGMSGPASLRVVLGAGDAALAGGARLRLVASYRGPGIAGRDGSRVAPGGIAVLRGREAEMVRRAARPGDGAPLCLVVDALAPRRRQSAKSRVSTASQSRST